MPLRGSRGGKHLAPDVGRSRSPSDPAIRPQASDLTQFRRPLLVGLVPRPQAPDCAPRPRVVSSSTDAWRSRPFVDSAIRPQASEMDNLGFLLPGGVAIRPQAVHCAIRPQAVDHTATAPRAPQTYFEKQGELIHLEYDYQQALKMIDALQVLSFNEQLRPVIVDGSRIVAERLPAYLTSRPTRPLRGSGLVVVGDVAALSRELRVWSAVVSENADVVLDAHTYYEWYHSRRELERRA